MSGIGLKAKWECPTCGNLLKTQFPAWSRKVLKAAFDEPSRCGCGRKGSFVLLSLDSCNYVVEEDNKDGKVQKVVENKEKKEVV